MDDSVTRLRRKVHMDTVNEDGAYCESIPFTVDYEATLNWSEVTCKKCIERHGFVAKRYWSHGKRTSEYTTWQTMLKRCYNKKNNSYQYYGLRGITVCERWKSFDNFMRDMGPKPVANYTIDRIDNNGNYEPSNCRWVSNYENEMNRPKQPRKNGRFVKHG